MVHCDHQVMLMHYNTELTVHTRHCMPQNRQTCDSLLTFTFSRPISEPHPVLYVKMQPHSLGMRLACLSLSRTLRNVQRNMFRYFHKCRMWMQKKFVNFDLGIFCRYRVAWFYCQIQYKKLIRRWDSKRELSLRRHCTRTRKCNRLLHKFRHRSFSATQIYQIQRNNAM